MSRTPRRALCVCSAIGLLASSAWAYRPFDGTDAAVADFHEVEFEVSPASYVREGDEKSLVAPSINATWGFAHLLECGLEGQQAIRLDKNSDGSRVQLTDAAATVKLILRRGRLQGMRGPSFAVESGLLLPTTETSSVGAIATPVLSLRSYLITVHLNGSQILTRNHRFEWLTSTIVAGPWNWMVQPVAEVLASGDYHLSRTAAERSILVGAIMPFGDDFSVDAAFRFGNSGGEALQEIRAGFTWTWAHHVRRSLLRGH